MPAFPSDLSPMPPPAGASKRSKTSRERASSPRARPKSAGVSISSAADTLASMSTRGGFVPTLPVATTAPPVPLGSRAPRGGTPRGVRSARPPSARGGKEGAGSSSSFKQSRTMLPAPSAGQTVVPRRAAGGQKGAAATWRDKGGERTSGGDASGGAASKKRGRGSATIVSPAVARPRGRPDNAPSRHELAPSGGGVALLFNCFKARWELHEGDVSTLSDHDVFDLKSARSNASLGRVKIAPEKGTSLVERVEFPNEWLVGEPHGLSHDGYQGEGQLDLRLEWRAEAGGHHAATLRVTPWMAYACSVGARFSIRKPGEAEGRSCTVQRTLPDDRCVVRVDGLASDPKKATGSGEDVVDASPSTVVLIAHPRRARAPTPALGRASDAARASQPHPPPPPRVAIPQVRVGRHTSLRSA